MPTAGALLATLVAGLASFLSPCTAPLVPGFLAYVGGLAAADTEAASPSRTRARMVAGAALYVAGFTVVFVLLGVGAGGVGAGLRRAGRPLEIAAGVALLVVGLTAAGWLRFGPLLAERRLRLPGRLVRAGPAGAFPLGVVVGIGWTPCVGPYLGAALSLAADAGHAVEGALLLLAYALGLGAPFLLLALAGAALPRLPRRLSRLAGPVSVAGGLVLAGLGVTLLAGAYGQVSSLLAQVSTGR